MQYSVKAILAEAEPVTLARVRERLHTLPGNEAEDTQTLLPLITAAREYCENRAGYAFIPQRIVAYPSREELLDGGFFLPRPPVVEIESVTGIADDGTETPLSGAQLVAGTEGPLLLEASLDGLRRVHPVAVTYTAGAAECPELAQQAILLLVGHWYMNREATGTATGEIALAVDAILKQYRRWW